MPSEEWDEYRIAVAHKWLNGIRQKAIESQRLCALVEDMRGKATGLKGIDYATQSFTHAPNRDAIPNAVAGIQIAVARYCTALSELTADQQQAERALSELEDVSYRAALTYHYLLNTTWAACCERMGYSEGGMMKLRRRALSAAYDVMPLSEKDPLPRAI